MNPGLRDPYANKPFISKLICCDDCICILVNKVPHPWLVTAFVCLGNLITVAEDDEWQVKYPPQENAVKRLRKQIPAMQTVIIAGNDGSRRRYELRQCFRQLCVFPIRQRVKAAADAKSLSAFSSIKFLPSRHFLGEESYGIWIMQKEILIEIGVIDAGPP